MLFSSFIVVFVAYDALRLFLIQMILVVDLVHEFFFSLFSLCCWYSFFLLLLLAFVVLVFVSSSSQCSPCLVFAAPRLGLHHLVPNVHFVMLLLLLPLVVSVFSLFFLLMFILSCFCCSLPGSLCDFPTNLVDLMMACLLTHYWWWWWWLQETWEAKYP